MAGCAGGERTTELPVEQLMQGSQTVTLNHACIWIAFCFFWQCHVACGI